jgi:hypothetical protein
MIDKIYIDSAKRIRKDYLELMKPLDFYLERLKAMSDVFTNAISDLESFNKNLHNKTKESAEQELFDKLSAVEEEQQKIFKVVDPINKKIEGLKKEEEALWEQIKMRYPDASEEELIKEIQSSLS